MKLGYKYRCHRYLSNIGKITLVPIPTYPITLKKMLGTFTVTTKKPRKSVTITLKFLFQYAHSEPFLYKQF